MTQNNFRSLSDIEAEYFQNNPKEIDTYITELFVRYAQDSDADSLLASLLILTEVKGITETVGITRQGLQKTLSNTEEPVLDNINAIMKAIGYQLMPQKIERP